VCLTGTSGDWGRTWVRAEGRGGSAVWSALLCSKTCLPICCGRYVYMFMCVYVHVYVYVYVYSIAVGGMCICLCVCMYMYMYMYMYIALLWEVCVYLYVFVYIALLCMTACRPICCERCVFMYV
jgi:hypothetical protein